MGSLLPLGAAAVLVVASVAFGAASAFGAEPAFTAPEEFAEWTTGDFYTVTGRGFGPGTTCTITLAEKEVKQRCTLNGDGDLDGGLIVPARMTSGEAELRVTNDLDRTIAQRRIVVINEAPPDPPPEPTPEPTTEPPLLLTPTLYATPDPVHVGGSLSVAGDNYTLADTCTVLLDEVTVATCLVDEHGHLTAVVTISDVLPPGTYRLRVCSGPCGFEGTDEQVIDVNVVRDDPRPSRPDLRLGQITVHAARRADALPVDVRVLNVGATVAAKATVTATVAGWESAEGTVTNLASGESVEVPLSLTPRGTPGPGTYTLTVSASPLAGEVSTGDNDAEVVFRIADDGTVIPISTVPTTSTSTSSSTSTTTTPTTSTATTSPPPTVKPPLPPDHVVGQPAAFVHWVGRHKVPLIVGLGAIAAALAGIETLRRIRRRIEIPRRAPIAHWGIRTNEFTADQAMSVSLGVDRGRRVVTWTRGAQQ